ncbi:hypothetical protein DYBT9275_05922 [Dyadobacter sp. CECT 9275]|uniref:Carboxypeptidase-like regulatory domain-containing protein n=1 Tax=Dyadobacter helix TaxID=2822344 RepID=A0A916JJU4_9BACT|nr:STN and carboxypeptidase regulatory-like domain-containing protein [Dyadobacter sp. CECT 9275]CAG5018086.1 hypothetical protein DYBT9275_05922 [Dyadobacter sp. CECT 9275]
MTFRFTSAKIWFFTLAALIGAATGSYAQHFLGKRISLSVNRQPVAEVLKTIGTQGGFYFSYNSNIIPGDSIVTVSYRSMPVKDILDQLLKGTYQYKETGNYVILQKAVREKLVLVSGSVLDEETGSPADYASVYSKTQLVSALTDEAGYFRLRVKDGMFPFSITVSKVGYGDTTLTIHSGSEVQIRIRPRAIELDTVLVRFSDAGRTWLGRLLVSSRLRLQSRNIGRFFVSLPYQASLTPGLGTHGKMSSQVENKVSLNLIGGYTGGVNGVEVAGVFNIARRDVKYFQAAGLFNVAGGNADGLQAAGFHNQVLDSLKGLQAAGFSNILNQTLYGVQAAGVVNKADGRIKGAQVAGALNLARNGGTGFQASGVFNYTAGKFHGVQVSGGVNVAREEIAGVQLACVGNFAKHKSAGMQLGVINYARRLKGFQLGVINVADSSSGVSLGFINIVRQGISNIAVYSNEIAPWNIAWKTGNRNLYTMLIAGVGYGSNKVYTFGMGVGKEFGLSKGLLLQTEISSQNVYLGQWENSPVLLRLQTALSVRLNKRFSVFGGPSFTHFYSEQTEAVSGYKSFPLESYAHIKMNRNTAAWFGWQGGMSWRYGR